ncbi:MAG: thioredoxin family protein [Planctomycetes bacterium]|nr:thioredoxin family protein [Planctomycetota bacterium]
MSKGIKIGIIVILALAIGTMVYIKSEKDNHASGNAQTPGPAETKEPVISEPAKALPRLVDLGSVKCIPCKKMAPILEQLKDDFKDRVSVEFIDVNENPDTSRSYGIRLIPTQVFYDAGGKEVFRHEGFFSREEILEQFKKMNIDVSAAERK